MTRVRLAAIVIALTALGADSRAEESRPPFHRPPLRRRWRRPSPASVLALEDGRAIVPSQRFWCHTGVELEKGQAVSITASGQVRGCHGPADNWAFGPWGPEGLTHEDKMICCLIAKVEGKAERDELYVGRSRRFSAALAGELHLGISDFFHEDNEGAFVVAVKVEGKMVDFWELAKTRPPARAPQRDAQVPAGADVDINWYHNAATGHYYRRSLPGTWPQTEKDAVKAGGHLVTVSDVEENHWLASIFGGGLWIGLTDRDEEGRWVWASGEDADFRNWRHGEPNNSHGNEDYALLYDGGDWNDLGPISNEWKGVPGIIERTTKPEGRVRSTVGFVGTFIDSDSGRPLPRFWVRFELRSPQAKEERRVKTDDDGRFAVVCPFSENASVTLNGRPRRKSSACAT